MAEQVRDSDESRPKVPVPTPEASLSTGDRPLTALEPPASGDGGPIAETEIWRGRTTFRHFAGRLLIWFVVTAGLSAGTIWLARQVEWLDAWGAFWVIAVLVLFGILLVIGPVVLRILGTRFRLTTQRLFIERGILSRTVDQTELLRVDDVRLHQTFWDRVFCVGSVQIVSTDSSDRQIVMDGIAGAEQVAELVRERMQSLRRKSLFVENL